MFGYTTAYVRDMQASLDFFVEAFRLPIRFMRESRTYGELKPGTTTPAFAAESLGDSNSPGDYVRNQPDNLPVGIDWTRDPDGVLVELGTNL